MLSSGGIKNGATVTRQPIFRRPEYVAAAAAPRGFDLPSAQQHIAGADCEIAPGIGKHEAACMAAHEKLRLDRFLDLSDRHRNGRRRDIQRIRRLANALVIGRREEVAELPQRKLGNRIRQPRNR